MKKFFLNLICQSLLFCTNICFFFGYVFLNYSYSEQVADVARVSDIDSCIDILTDDKIWYDKEPIPPTSKLYRAAELLGAIRDDQPKTIAILVERMRDTPMWCFSGIPKAKDRFVSITLSRIGESAIEQLFEKYACEESVPGDMPRWAIPTYICSILPVSSIEAVIDDFVERHKKDMRQECINRLLNVYKPRLMSRPELKLYDGREIPPLSDFTLNHPLYKARQATIESNLKIVQDILKANGAKKISAIDGELKAKLFAAIGKLGEVRAVEAAAVIAPLLLLESDDVDSNLDKKYLSFQKYPVGVALAKIGIPSIWAILDEIAIRSNQSDEYRQLAAKVTSTILIKKAIPGFVHEILDKHKDNEIAQIRLAKLLPLLGEDATKIPQLKPQLRTWKSTDGKFETHATFVSINTQKDITLKKENNKQTVIELSALRKLDQDYIREMTRP